MNQIVENFRMMSDVWSGSMCDEPVVGCIHIMIGWHFMGNEKIEEGACKS